MKKYRESLFWHKLRKWVREESEDGDVIHIMVPDEATGKRYEDRLHNEFWQWEVEYRVVKIRAYGPNFNKDVRMVEMRRVM